MNPGRAQPRIRDTIWDGQPQMMIFPNGRPKGMKNVLEEWGIDTDRIRAADIAKIGALSMCTCLACVPPVMFKDELVQKQLLPSGIGGDGAGWWQCV